MTGDPEADRSPRSATDEERLAAQRAVSPRVALMERLSLLEGEVPGAAAYQAARRLLPEEDPHPGMKPPPGAVWNPETGTWSVDHAAAMRLWSPDDGVGLPPSEMVDAFLTGYAERTGDDSARPLVEQLYAEAEKRLRDRGGAPESLSPSTKAEAVAVAGRHGFGEFVETVELDSSSRGFGVALAFAVLPAFFGVLLLFQADGDVLAVVGGVLLTVLAIGILALGVVALRMPAPVPRRLFLFTGGVVLGVDGVPDPYAWSDLELVERVVVSNVGSDHHEVREKLLLIGPLGRSTQFPVPSGHRETVVALGRAGGAVIR
ncbi:hypothetical protein [Saccharothrix sp. NRRL B-16314]|uniref:hypothetical protein n=1 Tax=Saccharothrix sp. NRRL B-16314 TaxID=1463825 RepID=UPI0005258434|nr:hypothetical protein [Saccharothrix sp. NRRL B-16314]